MDHGGKRKDGQVGTHHQANPQAVAQNAGLGLDAGDGGPDASPGRVETPRPGVGVIEPTPAELAAHREYIAALDKESRGRCLWLALDAAAERAAA
jgi:hypothetical protein